MAWNKAAVYVDNLLVGGRAKTKHDRNPNEDLVELREVAMHINKDKMKLCKDHVLFLGYSIKEGKCGMKAALSLNKKGFLLFLLKRRLENYLKFSTYDQYVEGWD